MSENKTKPTAASIAKFIDSIPDDSKREDSKKILKMMKEITGVEPKMWGPSIIGFDQYHYKYESGREGDYFMVGFSPRKQNLSIYIMPGFEDYTEELQKLGKHKTGKSCLYIKSLAEIDESALKQLIKKSYQQMKKTYK